MALSSFNPIQTRKGFVCIQDFFDDYGLVDAVKALDHILDAATCNKVWKKGTPYLLLCYLEKLELLCKAAYTIYYERDRCAAAILTAPENGEPAMDVYSHYIGRHAHQTVWSYFPRHLTASQFHNPYKALGKFSCYMSEPEWLQCLKDIRDYALSKESIVVMVPGYHILSLRRRLMQLIEGCFLLVVRERAP